METIREGFRNLNVFGLNVRWNNYGTKKSISKVGKITTVCFFCLIVYAVYIAIDKMVNKNGPNVTKRRYVDGNPAQQLINSKTFSFAFGMATPDTYNHYIDASIYTIKAVMFQQTRTRLANGTVARSHTITNLALQECNQAYFGDSEEFKTLDFNNLLCIKDEQPIPASVAGTWESEFYSRINVDVEMCNNATSSVTCKPQSEIEAKIRQGVFAVFHRDITIDPTNYENPVKTIRASEFFMTSPEIFKEAYVYTKNVDINTDSNLIGSANEKNKQIAYSHFTETGAHRRTGQDMFLKFYIKVSPEGEIFSRAYPKLQVIMAQFWASIVLYLVLITIFSFPIEKFYFYSNFVENMKKRSLQLIKTEGLVNKKEEDQKKEKGAPSIATFIDLTQYETQLDNLKKCVVGGEGHYDYDPNKRFEENMQRSIEMQEDTRKVEDNSEVPIHQQDHEKANKKELVIKPMRIGQQNNMSETTEASGMRGNKLPPLMNKGRLPEIQDFTSQNQRLNSEGPENSGELENSGSEGSSGRVEDLQQPITIKKHSNEDEVIMTEGNQILPKRTAKVSPQISIPINKIQGSDDSDEEEEEGRDGAGGRGGGQSPQKLKRTLTKSSVKNLKNFSACQYFLSSVCCFGNEKSKAMSKVFDHRKKHIDNILDINNVVRMKGQIEALKKILFPKHKHKDFERLVWQEIHLMEKKMMVYELDNL